MKYIIVKEINDCINKDIDIHSITRTTTTVKAYSKSKYERHIHINTTNIVLRNVKKYNTILITKRSNKRGARIKYNTDEERHEARKASKNNSYAKRTKQLKKDTNKSITDTLKKTDIVQATKDFYGKHYSYNYLLTPQHFFTLDKWDSRRIHDSDMYNFAIQQDKYQKQYQYTLEDCIKKVNYILSKLKKDGKLIYDNYYYVIHKSHYTNTYHPHILLHITHTSIKNVHTFLHNKAIGYMKKYQKRATVKLYDIENMFGYLNEEYKRNNKEELNIVYSDCNIDRHANRMVTQSDLLEDLQHGITTYTHTQTLNKLKKYGIQRKTA